MKTKNLNNPASKDTIRQHTKAFSRLPYTMEKTQKLEIWRNSNWKKMEKLNVIFYSIILLMCAYNTSVARTRMWHQQLVLDINMYCNNVQVSVILNILEET